jgi:hypothetical protein
MQNLDKEDYKDRKKVLYSVMVSAWVNTRFERDRQLLGLSATAVGLLVTLLRTLGVQDQLQLLVFSLALFSFLATIASVLMILHENSEHIENVLEHTETESNILAFLDKIAWGSFVLGMLLTAVIGIESGKLKLN